VWGSEFTTKVAPPRGDPEDLAPGLNVNFGV
jgi:hypothetical protein